MYWLLLIPFSILIFYILWQIIKKSTLKNAILQSLDTYNFHFLDATPAPVKQRRHLMHRDERYDIDNTGGHVKDLTFCEEHRVTFHDKAGAEHEAMVKLRYSLFRFREAEWQPPLDSFSEVAHLKQSTAPGSKN